MSEEGSPKGLGNVVLGVLARAPRLIGLVTITVVGVWLATFGDDISGKPGEALKVIGVIAAAVGLGIPLIGETVLYLKEFWEQLNR